MDKNSFSKSDSSLLPPEGYIPGQDSLQHPPFHEIQPHLKHSGPGIASFVISVVALVGYIISFVIVGFLYSSILNELGELTNDSSQAFLFLGSAILGLAALNVIGVVLGIIGISIRNRRKIFGIIGTIINGVIILVFMLLITTVLVNAGAQ